MLITGMVISFAQMIDPVCMAVLITDYKRAIAKVRAIQSYRRRGFSSVPPHSTTDKHCQLFRH